jgi:hypothetical protein
MLEVLKPSLLYIINYTLVITLRIKYDLNMKNIILGLVCNNRMYLYKIFSWF